MSLQIIHCPASSMMRKQGVRGTTWIIEKSESRTTEVQVRHSICHPQDQFSRKKGVAAALTCATVSVSKVNLIKHINRLFSHKENLYLTPSDYEIYQAVVRT